MRKVQIYVDGDPDNLMRRVNEFFKKAENNGYEIICTNYSIGGMSGYAAFIDYKPKESMKKTNK